MKSKLNDCSAVTKQHDGPNKGDRENAFKLNQSFIARQGTPCSRKLPLNTIKAIMIKTLRITVSAIAVFAAVSSAYAQQNSGFLTDSYSKLQDTQSASGSKVKRWLAPGFDIGKYDSVLLEKTVFFPEPQGTEQVSVATLASITGYLDEALRRELSGVIKVVDQPGARTLRFKPAITAADSGNVGLKAYQLIPIALVFTMAKRASGTAAQQATLSVEFEARDAQSNAVVGAGMRQGTEPLQNPADGVTLNAVKPVIDSWAKDARLFLQAKQ